jgi:hypothetical protein
LERHDKRPLERNVVQLDEGPIVLRNTDLIDITMEEAYIFRARRPPEPAPAPVS